MRGLSAQVERWPIAGAFTIARGSKTEAVVVTVEISEDGITGRGEGTPYARYGETPESVLAEIRTSKKFEGEVADKTKAALEAFGKQFA